MSQTEGREVGELQRGMEGGRVTKSERVIVIDCIHHRVAILGLINPPNIPHTQIAQVMSSKA